jgi:hypothetical protein
MVRARSGMAAPSGLCAATALVLTLALLAPSPVLSEEFNPLDGVFQLVTLTQDGRGIARGTAFFVDPNGTALTNSHVVYRVQHDPEHYLLLAVVDREFYGVTIVCASPLEVDPFEASRGTVGRDVAVVQLTPPAFTFTQWGLFPPGGQPQVIAAAHVGPLPRFPVLSLGGGPQERAQIRVIGFGRPTQSTEKMVATGTITKTATARDGTPVFEIEALERPDRGSSGSPVLDEQNRVVGMYTWNELSRAAGLAISSTALVHACP